MAEVLEREVLATAPGARDSLRGEPARGGGEAADGGGGSTFRGRGFGVTEAGSTRVIFNGRVVHRSKRADLTREALKAVNRVLRGNQRLLQMAHLMTPSNQAQSGAFGRNHGAPFEAQGRLPVDSDDLTAEMHLKMVSGRARRDAGDHSPPWHSAYGPYVQPSHPRVTKHDFVARAGMEQG